MKNKYLVAIAALVFGLGVTLLAVEKTSGSGTPKLIRLKSSGDTIAELRVLKGTMVEITSQQSNYDVQTQTQVAKGEVRIRIVPPGGSPVVVTADEIEALPENR